MTHTIGPMHPRISINQVCFSGAVLAEFLGRARALGARGISFNSPSLLSPGGAAQAQATLAGSGLSVESICHPFAVYPTLDGDCGQAQDTLQRLVEIGAQLETRSIYLLTGGRGFWAWDRPPGAFLT